MVANIKIKSETAKRLRSLAKARKMSVEDLLSRCMPELAAEPKRSAHTDQKVRQFENWLKTFSSDAPPLSDYAVSRESIYGDR